MDEEQIGVWADLGRFGQIFEEYHSEGGGKALAAVDIPGLFSNDSNGFDPGDSESESCE